MKMKRIFSIILATAMLISILPSVFATAETETEGYKYDFTASVFSESGESLTYLNLKTKTMSDVRGAVSAPWKWAGFSFTYSLYSNETGVQMNIEPHRAEKSLSYVVLELDVKNGGEYIPSLTYKTGLGSLKGNIYLIKNVDTIADFSVETLGQVSDPAIGEYVEKWKKGEISGYQLADNSDFSAETEEKLTFDKCTLDADSTYYLIFNFTGYSDPKDVVVLYHAKSFELEAVKSEVSDVEKAFDYAENNHVGTGTASITAYAVYGTDGETSETQTIATPSVTYGSTCKITAPESYNDEESGKTYKFLYWAKGMTMGKKQVVSYSATIPEYRPYEGVNYLIAVYEEVGANANAVEFYNANGELLDIDITADNKLPSLPSMAGYGKASMWALRNTDGTYTEYEEGADAPVSSGSQVFMAKYEELQKDIRITVNGKDNYYAYGDTVLCTSSEDDFSYWTKTVNGTAEIVSTEKEYTFNAYEACTVTAVCDGAVDLGKTMRKIILGTFAVGNETAVMAEFIGFEDALEKGIMFGNQRIAMSTDKTQFTVINDIESTTVTGYAIIDDNGLKEITDGALASSAE